MKEKVGSLLRVFLSKEGEDRPIEGREGVG
jgi:hypothetical protein